MNPVFKIVFGASNAGSRLRQRIHRRLTRSGYVIFGGIILTALTGLDTDSTVAYQAFPLLLLLLFQSCLWGFFFRARFSSKRLLPKFATVGSPFTYRVIVRNLGRKRQAGLTLLENVRDPQPEFREWLAVQLADERRIRTLRLSQGRRSNPFRLAKVREASLPSMVPGEESEAIVELTPLRRGLLRFTGVTLARPDPLGFVRAFSSVPLLQTMLILPKRYNLPAIGLPGNVKYQEGGVALASNIGESEEFVALRDYRRGDPMRHIHWRSWAKVGKPIVKEFEDEFFVRHALVLDTFTDDPRSDAFEECVSVAASFACTMATQESLLDLLFAGSQAYCFTAGRGLAHTDQMLEVLASVRACGDRSFSILENLVIDHASTVSGCVCVLLAWDEPRRRLVDKIRALGVPVLVLVVVEAGKAEAVHFGAAESMPERFHVLEVGRIEEGLAKVS